MDWAEEVDDKGLMWATLGPYLRRSLLQNLVRFVAYEACQKNCPRKTRLGRHRAVPAGGEKQKRFLRWG